MVLKETLIQELYILPDSDHLRLEQIASLLSKLRKILVVLIMLLLVGFNSVQESVLILSPSFYK